ncbi:glutamate receptor ionotropic, NMDA 3A-like isoform X7 [Malaya genurostris]|uniref:glutamate receptor ionotropic, NMDA 3A-like isoform X7 n=1 Tax=Malaya genurostris TaxID=325434 RepID=UPI0026F3DAD6|nr:glutamate receptor ionotropic, NMDA 3A-like isoform X7 [Malaya genurostris]
MIRLSLTSSVFILFAQIIFRKHFVSSGFESFYYKSDNESYRAPKHEALLRSPTADRTLPVFPDNSNTVYFIIALHGGGKLWSSMLARTLLDMGTPFTNPLGPPLKPIILDLPSNGRYTSKILTTLCDLIDSVPLAGMIVVGEGQASKMVALAGSSMKIPVLWAKGGVASFQGTANELMSKSQAILQPSSREIFAALQSILLKTGWYSFYILSDIKTTMLLEGNEGYGLKMKPLHATIIQLPTNSDLIKRYLHEGATIGLAGQSILGHPAEKSLIANFEILNLVPVMKHATPQNEIQREAPGYRADYINISKWRRVGFVSGRNVHLDTIVWPNGDIVVTGLPSKARFVFRIVVALAPPFVMETKIGDNEKCLRGVLCYQMYNSGRTNLSHVFNLIETRKRSDVTHKTIDTKEEARTKTLYSTRCCFGLSMDLLQKVAQDVGFEFDLYIVHDGFFGRKIPNKKDYSKIERKKIVEFSKFDAQSGRSLKRGLKLSQILDVVSETMDTNEQPKPLQTHPKHQWNGIVGELVSGSADMSFAPLSVSKERAKVIDFSVPFFHGSVSLLAAPQSSPDVPLLAFLLPFSHELWIAIFTSLNITAVAVAIYEWLSPFGLNPWGRQRSKNFSMSSALWVMWGLLCGHLVAFKAPKSWPNKFLINVWGGFSVIFIASYTANIAALIAGLLFHNESGGYSGPLLKQRIGVPLATAAEYYVQTNDKILWEHMKRYQLLNIENGIERLKNGTIDLLMADSPILDYYRATDLGCTLQRVGDTYVDDSYAIGMNKGFPLKETISALISKYSSDGTLDILTEKWYGSLACFKLDRDIGQPKPLGVRAVAGVFLLLGFGMILGLLILVFEHVFYKYALPVLRHQPKNTVWKSRNIMFFSQKLYRFINYVELVSPHHSAKELVHTIRQGQITSLFQKSIKRKEDEQRRRRKSKAKFYDMIQEIRSTRFTLDYLLDKQTMDV